jgi:hypothetical protein
VLKLGLLSIVLATLVIPMLAARARRPLRAFVSMALLMLMVQVGYAVFLYALYLRIVRWT